MDYDFQVTQTPDAFWCLEQNGVRSFLLEGLDNALLVDSCFGGDIAQQCRMYASHEVQLVLTHSDPDHTGGVAQFDYYMMHPAEFDRWASQGHSTKQVIPLWEGEQFSLDGNYRIGGYKLDVLHLPGHTPGGIGLLERNRRFLIAGDMIQSGGCWLFGPGRNVDAYRASLLKLISMEDTFDRIYCSHGELILHRSILRPLYRFVNDICRGVITDSKPAPAHLPENVRLFERDECRVLLEVK